MRLKNLRMPWVGLLLLTPALLVGCADNPPAPIETRQGVALNSKRGTVKPEVVVPHDYRAPLDYGEPYKVEQGDTLYSIAFRLGADYRRLAQVNNIAPPYLIYPGQTLSTIDSVAGSVGDGSVGVGVSHPPVTTATPEVATGPNTGAGVKTTAQVTPKPEVKPGSQPKAASKPSSKPIDGAVGRQQAATAPKSESGPTPAGTKSVPKAPVPTAPAPKITPPAPQTQAVAIPVQEPKLGPVTRWLWPGKGPVERAYSAVLHKGIDITGQRGDPVYATAAGVVVYAGTGVKGYGVLLIVKHNEQFLSAYGHNDVMLVAEGASIRAGQQIARMGSSGTDTVKLHFEIRRKGQPVDPLRLLPRR